MALKYGDLVRVSLDYETRVDRVHHNGTVSVISPHDPAHVIAYLPESACELILKPEAGDIWETPEGVSYIVLQRSNLLAQRIDQKDGNWLDTAEAFLVRYPGARLVYRKGYRP